MRRRVAAIGGVVLMLGLGPSGRATAEDAKPPGTVGKNKASEAPLAADACTDVCRRGQKVGIVLVDNEKALYKVCFEAGLCAQPGITLKKVYQYTPPGLFDPLLRMLPSGGVI